MDEKVLIKSQCYNFKKWIVVLVLIGFIVSVLLFVSELGPHTKNYDEDVYIHNSYGHNCGDSCKAANYDSAFSYALDEIFVDHLDSNWVIFLPIILSCVGGVVLYFCLKSYHLTVTDKRIFGQLAWGKRIDLPIDSVSAVSIGAFKSITISTSSGRISFPAIKNRNEIYEVVNRLLVERQKKPTTPVQTTVPAQATSSADELKKFKELLDSGVITREEFESKKKQLLGL